ncbi:MAG: copper resistance protein CopB [Candidatus Solibacter sp.]|nr:copper resistance protein CopB [Candidatus Solibacter sp.]
MDDHVFTYFIFNQLEARTTGPEATFRWDGQGWIGGKYNKLWFKSEGKVTSGKVSDGDHEVL